MADVYGDLIRADKIKPGDRLEYKGIDNKLAIVTVATADLLPSCNPNFPNQIHFQIDHPEMNRIAWGVSVKDYLQIVERERLIIPSLIKKPFIEEAKPVKKFKLGSSLVKKKGLRAKRKKG